MSRTEMGRGEARLLGCPLTAQRVPLLRTGRRMKRAILRYERVELTGRQECSFFGRAYPPCPITCQYQRQRSRDVHISCALCRTPTCGKLIDVYSNSP